MLRVQLTSLSRAGLRARLAGLVLGWVLWSTPVMSMVIAWPAAAEQAIVAVATNFAEPAREIAARMTAATGQRVVIATGSTGQLYAQVMKGAPYHALLAADGERPERLVAEGRAVAESRFTYALGRLVVWSADPGVVGADGRATLAGGAFRRLAIANPELAPYGAAARQVLERLGLWATLKDRIVQGANIGQVHAMVATGNAELGFVAQSSLAAQGGESGSRWLVPPGLHAPIRQDAVLLTAGETVAAARAFLAFLAGPEARGIIERYGYGVD